MNDDCENADPTEGDQVVRRTGRKALLAYFT